RRRRAPPGRRPLLDRRLAVARREVRRPVARAILTVARRHPPRRRVACPVRRFRPTSRSMRVLTVIDSLDPSGGAEQSLAAMAPALVAEGVELHVAYLRERPRSIAGPLRDA